MRTLLTRLFVTLFACCAAMPAFAVGVHKWVDEQGITHYSDEPPEAGESILIDLPDADVARSDSDSSENYYSIPKQWERMNQERLEREKLALEKARVEAARQPSATTTVYVRDHGRDRIIPVYRDYRFRKIRGIRRHHRSYPGQRMVKPMPAAPLVGKFHNR